MSLEWNMMSYYKVSYVSGRNIYFVNHVFNYFIQNHVCCWPEDGRSSDLGTHVIDKDLMGIFEPNREWLKQ